MSEIEKRAGEPLGQPLGQDPVDSTSAAKQKKARETKELGEGLTRQLVLAKLAPPGSEAFVEREDSLFKALQETGWLAGKAKQMGIGDRADDVQQRVLTRLLVDFRQGRLFAISRGYVANTVAFECKSLWRKKSPSLLSEQDDSQLSAGAEPPDEDFAEVAATLGRVWSRLDPRQRRVLSLYYPDWLGEGQEDSGGRCESGGDAAASGPVVAWTLEQIGRELKLSIASVHRIKGKAMQAFFDGLRDEGLAELAEMLANQTT
jgi:hypothetical protein